VHADDDEAMLMAAFAGRTEIVRTLLDAGGNMHAADEETLQMSAYRGHSEIVKALLNAEADPHARDDWALRWASYRGHAETPKVVAEWITRASVNGRRGDAEPASGLNPPPKSPDSEVFPSLKSGLPVALIQLRQGNCE
jgi:hypothetical protein